MIRICIYVLWVISVLDDMICETAATGCEMFDGCTSVPEGIDLVRCYMIWIRCADAHRELRTGIQGKLCIASQATTVSRKA